MIGGLLRPSESLAARSVWVALLQLLSLEWLVTDLDAGVPGAELVDVAESGPLTRVDEWFVASRWGRSSGST